MLRYAMGRGWKRGERERRRDTASHDVLNLEKHAGAGETAGEAGRCAGAYL